MSVVVSRTVYTGSIDMANKSRFSKYFATRFQGQQKSSACYKMNDKSLTCTLTKMRTYNKRLTDQKHTHKYGKNHDYPIIDTNRLRYPLNEQSEQS